MTYPPALSRAGHARALMALGLPLIGSNLAQMLLHVTDTVMLGWYGVTELAAVVLGASAFFIVFILGSGFAQAVMPMAVAALGRGDEAQVRRDTRMGLWLSIGFGLFSYPLFWWSDPILRALGQAADVSALAQDYLRIAAWGMVPALLVMVLKSYLAASERTAVVLWITVLAVGVNAGINYALIFGRFGAPEFRMGWPIGLTGLAEGGMFQATALMMGWIGTMQLAAHGIALEVTALAFMVHLGFSNAATVRVARALGRGDVVALRRGAGVALMLSLGFGLTMVVLFLALSAPIVALFLDAQNPQTTEIIAYGSILLALSAVFQMVDAAQVMAMGFLRGLHDTRVPMWIATLSYWVIGIPASYVFAFPLNFGGAGLWLGLTTGLTVAALLLMTRFWRRASRLSRPGL